MSSITEIEVKGWVRDGVEQWTVGMKVDFDALFPEIPGHAVETATRTIESAKSTIRANLSAPKAPSVKAGEPYNAMAKGWNCCPTCGSSSINKTSKQGKPFQACYECKVFLEPDGSVKEMKRDG